MMYADIIKKWLRINFYNSVQYTDSIPGSAVSLSLKLQTINFRLLAFFIICKSVVDHLFTWICFKGF